MDIVQVTLLFVVLILSGMLFILGFQVAGILKEVHATLSRVNRILENAGKLTETAAKPLLSLSGIVLGVKTVINALSHEEEKPESLPVVEKKKNTVIRDVATRIDESLGTVVKASEAITDQTQSVRRRFFKGIKRKPAA
ncbi:MAG: hypothetical protein Q8N98_01350 [bacterium]|nr:hypothetical protein [bacterium]